ncbi:hypothetical protein BC827DRAFT_337627 [Russula dissimulans]|nr:hypothetical protein BC827DRAFT_337627 [Russula dissimulans]
MVKWYYTVIVGTQPGVYADWTQVAPKVSEISGAIHKKFKTRAEALEAFNRATREGTVRVVPVDQELDAASLASSRSSSPLPVARDNYQRLRPRHYSQERQLRRAASHGHAIARPPPRPAPRLGRSFRSSPRPSAITSNILSPTHAGPSNLVDTTRRVSVGAEAREHEQSDQGSRTRPDYVYRTQPSSSPSSRFADYIRAPSPVGPHNRGNERWWEIHQRSVGALPSSFGVDDRISIPRGQASPSGHSTYRLSRSPQLEANQDIGSQVYASGSQSFGVDLVVSPRSHGEGESEDSYLVSFDRPRNHEEAPTLQTRHAPIYHWQVP